MSRRRRAPRREAGTIQQLPWTRVRSPYPPIEIFGPEQIEQIHDAGMRILEEFGIEVMSAQARRYYAAAGADVDEGSGLVRLDRDLVLSLVAKAPREVTLTPRNPDRALTLGGNHINFGLVAGPPNIHDRVNGRRPGNLEDYGNLLKLAQSLNIVHLIGNQPTAPVELPANTRHLDCYDANATLTDLVFHCSAIGAARALDGIDIAAIARGKTREELIDDPSVVTIISVNSPRRLDGAMADGLIAMSEWGQCVCVTPFTLMGAMTPVTLPAALAQQNAEALAGIALTQIVRPGAPAIYGAFTSNVDMRSGAPAFGTPENAQAQMAAGQLARRYGLPYRASNANASNTVDAQAAYESQNDIWAGVMGHANLLYHGAGWLEGGLTASFEKVVLDAELLQMMAELVKVPEVNAETLAVDAIGDVDPGGHFFGTEHTMARYESAFYAPILSDWRNYEAWLEAGGEPAEARATRIWQQLLESYQPPPMDPGVREALDAFVARRKEELADQDI
jgi:trimethylamine--corrinoid protein Co-methyltransferase